MSDRETHLRFGIVTGLGLSAYRARDQQPLHMLCETLGGAVGGYLGGRLPDLVEPATWPGHRQFAHSVTAGTGAILGINKVLQQWETRWRSKAADCLLKKEQCINNGNEVSLYTFKELALHFMAGFLSGMVAGYLSHLVLDENTPKSLPFFG